jgi:hypothetical protein
MLIIEPKPNHEKINSNQENWNVESTLIREIKNELDGYVITSDIAPYAEFHAQYDHNNLYIENRFNSFLDIIEKNNYPYQKIFNNHYIKWEEFENFYTTPIFFLNSVENFSQLDISQYNYTDQTNIFAAMYKPREARLIVSAWLSNSGITDFNYTQGWNLDPEYINKLSDLVRRHHENLTTLLPRNFIDCPLSDKKNNAYLFDNFFKPYFCSSTIAIVTEPVFFEKASLITEKYLSAIYGCCFPIFCGGYNMANDIKEIGFDVFDDIIDHSYQTEPDPTTRVLDALNINSEILYSKTLKKTDYMHRHKKNLELVRQRKHEFYKQFAKNLELIPKNETARTILMNG